MFVRASSPAKEKRVGTDTMMGNWAGTRYINVGKASEASFGNLMASQRKPYGAAQVFRMALPRSPCGSSTEAPMVS